MIRVNYLTAYVIRFLDDFICSHMGRKWNETPNIVQTIFIVSTTGGKRQFSYNSGNSSSDLWVVLVPSTLLDGGALKLSHSHSIYIF